MIKQNLLIVCACTASRGELFYSLIEFWKKLNLHVAIHSRFSEMNFWLFPLVNLVDGMM